MQRLLWASTGTKDPNAPDTLYVQGLAAPFTINTMPDKTLEAFYDHGDAGDPMPPDGGSCDELFAKFEKAGVDLTALAAKLQSDGARSFVDSWGDLMTRIEEQSSSVA
jgi:transaldolase